MNEKNNQPKIHLHLIVFAHYRGKTKKTSCVVLQISENNVTGGKLVEPRRPSREEMRKKLQFQHKGFLSGRKPTVPMTAAMESKRILYQLFLILYTGFIVIVLV